MRADTRGVRRPNLEQRFLNRNVVPAMNERRLGGPRTTRTESCPGVSVNGRGRIPCALWIGRRRRDQYVHGYIDHEKGVLVWPTLEALAAAHGVTVAAVEGQAKRASPPWTVQCDEARADVARERAATARDRALEMGMDIDSEVLEAARSLIRSLRARAQRLEADVESAPALPSEADVTARALGRAYELARIARGDLPRDEVWWGRVVAGREQRRVLERARGPRM